MKYQSEIIAEIVEKRGHEKSSLHYESECKETWIKENEMSYPKLIDYEGEWLNYINENPIGEFPYQTLTDVTDATVENVVPYAYKSAILRGQTLVNLIDKNKSSTKPLFSSARVYRTTTLNGEECVLINGNNRNYIDLINPPKGDFTIKCRASLTSEEYSCFQFIVYYEDGTSFKSERKLTTSIDKLVDIEWYHNPTKTVTGIALDSSDAHATYVNINKFVVVEGNYMNNLSYFDGMTSVKMPFLTTSNEDGTKTNILSTPEDLELRGIGDVQDTLDCLTREMTQRIGETILDGSESWVLNGTKEKTQVFAIHRDDKLNDMKKNTLIMCDKIKVTSGIDDELIVLTDSIYLALLKSKASTVEELRAYLSQNPLTVQYQLATESIKTVDLTSINENGEQVRFKPIEGTMHLSTSSETIKPSFSGEIPVEAITQNLMSFIGDE